MPGVRSLIRRSRRKTKEPASEGGGAKETPGAIERIGVGVVGGSHMKKIELTDVTNSLEHYARELENEPLILTDGGFSMRLPGSFRLMTRIWSRSP